MPTIEITEDQREYIEDLREELADHHVGEYGTVRTRDAVQFLIDHHESGATKEDAGAGTTDVSDDAGARSGGGAGEAPGDEEDGGPERLNAMMQLLDEHDDKWEEVDSEEGKYAVTLPDGGTDHVRTRDDVRALLFRHYD